MISKVIKTQFATKISDDTEDENVGHSQSTDVIISKRRRESQENAMCSSQDLIQVPEETIDENEGAKVQEIILAKIDGLGRQMSKGFAKLSKSGDNNYNDIKSMIPTHSVFDFDSLNRILHEDDYLYQKMKRYLQRYRSVATTNDVYGSVLKRIVDDKVLLEYNYHGVKNKIKIEDYAVVDMLFGKLFI